MGLRNVGAGLPNRNSRNRSRQGYVGQEGTQRSQKRARQKLLKQD
jgi:hypothetical protein